MMEAVLVLSATLTLRLMAGLAGEDYFWKIDYYDLEFCLIYEPIFANYDYDTQETIDQIDRDNLIYDDLCT